MGSLWGLSTQDAFTKIYDENHWGKSDDPAQPFYSGVGSHAPPIVDTYIKAVKEFLSSLEEKPTVVDLGCGDFYVGAQLRDLCGDYIACDIVEPLIKFNTEKYKSLNVDFRVLDLSKDELPAADIVFVRQVFQHLSNKEILASLEQICSKFKYLILTEHLPGQETFTPNLDKPSGRYNRVAFQSGIVLTEPPFNLKPVQEKTLSDADEGGTILRTTLYQLSA